MFLLVSEFSFFQGYFARYWPLFSSEHGFVALAIAMLVLGTDILGNLNKQSNSQEALGLAFWQITIASGIIIFILGWINLVAVSSITSLHHYTTNSCYRVSSSATARNTSQLAKSELTVLSLRSRLHCHNLIPALPTHQPPTAIQTHQIKVSLVMPSTS